MTTPAQPADRRALLQNALQALDDMQAKLAAVERAKHEPIAIVGMSCRFPGGANDPEAYWQLLCEGGDALGEYPPERQALLREAGVDLERLGVQANWPGGFLKQLDQFDPQFFGITPREATTMDPQQRLVLEASWEALERAGQAPDRLSGSLTGMFLGITTNDYLQLAKLGDAADLDVYTATGNALNAAAGRVAYTLGLQGPSMAVDTACSSSLVAVHLACQSLRLGESNLALAGGVNVALMPESFICFTRWGMMAPDGRCKTFDAAADGFVRSEGCGMVVLKRLSDALADGDTVLAVIRGSAVNQDGRSSGLTVPNGPAQQAVLRQALASAGVEPAQVQYVEAHGTGTALGDPIEVEALGAVLGKGRKADQPLMLGSVKTNIGHVESAAGIAGLIKTVLALQHGVIPPHLHLHERSPKIPWPSFPIEIPTVLTPWPARDGRRIAGVSGFGFSGTNAHIVLEAAPEPTRAASDTARPLQLLTLSAKSEPALRQLAERYATQLNAQPALALADVAYTANTGRAQFAQRLALTAANTAQAAKKLAAFAAGETTVGIASGAAQRTGRPRVAFLFTGQGAQYVGMGQQLYHTQPVFRSALDRCAALLQPQLGRNIRDIIFAQSTETGALLDDTTYTQPALFALEYALSELWRSWGIVPTVVLGHSVGEYVAAVVAGVFSLEDGLKLIAARARLMGALPTGGAMAAIFAPEAQVRELLAPHRAQLAIAAVNGPAHTVISGAATAVQTIADAFATTGVRVQRLTVSHAFHSPLMEPMLAEFERVAASVRFQPPRIDIVSNLSGQLAGADITTPTYWRRHVREGVQFATAMNTLHGDEYDLFVECGPHPVLIGMGQHCLPPDSAHWLPSLRKGRDDWQQLLDSLGALSIHGAEIDWAGFESGDVRRKLTLPTYPFQRQRYWVKPVQQRARIAAPTPAHNVHPLLGQRLRSPLIKETLFETTISASNPAYLAEHQIFGATVFPGSAYLEMALAAAAASGTGTPIVEMLSIRERLALPQAGARVLQLALTPSSNTTADVQILSADANEQMSEGFASPAKWSTHATGAIRLQAAGANNAPPEPVDIAHTVASFTHEVAVDAYYEQLYNLGLEYGPTFRCLTQLYRGEGRALGFVQLPASARDDAPYHLHPGLLDACFHVIGAVLSDPDAQNADAPVYVPVEVAELHVFQSGSTALWCEANVNPGVEGAEIVTARLHLFDAEGRAVATFGRLTLKRISRALWRQAAQPTITDWLYTLDWQPQLHVAIAATSAARRGAWLVFADTSGVAAMLAQRLTAQGATCVLVFPSTKATPGYQHVDPFDPHAIRTLIDDVRVTAGPLQGVVHLWGLEPVAPHATLAELQAAEALACGSALQLVQALAAQPGTAPRLWLVTRGTQPVAGSAVVDAAHAALSGLARVIASEHPDLQCSTIDLDASTALDDTALFAEIWTPSAENQIAFRDTRYVARLVHQAVDEQLTITQPLQMELPARGMLDNVTFQLLVRRAPERGKVEIEVRATGLNFRDVLNVLGMYPGDPGMPGLECAGIITAVGDGVTELSVGDAVVALAPRSFDSFVVTDAELAVRKPDQISFAEAVTIPSAFLTAYHGLYHLAHLRSGERVLIHAAAGGVGLAAVQLAQRVGAEVFATAGSAEKHAFLRALGVQHIFSSRTLDFADEILTLTGGQGVDVVLNSLADEFITRSFDVLAANGRFLEIGKRGIWTHAQVAAAKPNATYLPFDIGEVLLNQPHVIHEMMCDVMAQCASGQIKPLPIRAFPRAETIDAFRYMAQAKHIGKVVVTHPLAHTSDSIVRDDGSYLVTGGLGGLGLRVAEWLVAQGARHIALVGRRAPSSAAAEQIAAMQRAGAEVRVFAADVGCDADVTRLLASIAAELPPLRGIVHAAGALDDGALLQQNWERFRHVFAAKVDGAWLLHQHTHGLPLDFFALFSSASALLGSPGQGNYAAGNAFMDALAHQRHAKGLPATSINWGAWSEVGMAAAHSQRWAASGIRTITPDEGVRALGYLLRRDIPQAAVLPINWAQFSQQSSTAANTLLLSELTQAAKPQAQAETLPAISLTQQLEAALPSDRRALLMDHVRQQIVIVLGLDSAYSIDSSLGLTDIGMDSLMAVELSNRLRANIGRSLPSTLAFEYPTLSALTDFLANDILALDLSETPKTTAPVEDPDAEMLAELAELSDDEAESYLLKELEETGY